MLKKHRNLQMTEDSGQFEFQMRQSEFVGNSKTALRLSRHIDDDMPSGESECKLEQFI